MYHVVKNAVHRIC